MIRVLLAIFIYILAPLLFKGNRLIRTVPFTLLYLLEMVFTLYLWIIVVLPFVYFDQKFNIAVRTYVVILFLIFIGLLLKSVRNKEYYREGLKQNIKFVDGHKWKWLILFIVLGYQVFRCAFFQTIAYSDSKTYIALVNDIVETNRFYLLNDVNGSIISDISDVPQKYSLAAWYSFEAAISYLFKMHPLVIINTVLPPVIMILAYISLWLLSSLLFKNQVDKRVSFLLAIALFYQFLNDDPAMFFLIWPTWGKNIVMSIMLPLLIYLYYTKEIGKRFSRCMIFIVSFAACFTSTMGVFIMPMVSVIISVIDIINKRKVNMWNMLAVVPVFMSVFIYACLYVVW